MAILNVRPIDEDAAKRIKRAARVRGITVGEYLARLVALHEELRQRPDIAGAVMERLGLQQVKE